MGEFELEPGEKITLTVRKHWLVLVGYSIPYAIAAYLPVLIVHYLASGVLGAASAATATFSFDNGGVRFVVGTYWLIVWMFYFGEVTRYFLNQWVVTTTRIVDIAQHGFFQREVSSVLLLHVQDVSTDIEGFFNTLANFGTLEVESAGAAEKFIMSGLNDPKRVRDLIMHEIAELHLDGSKHH
jgi:hypothetical protein